MQKRLDDRSGARLWRLFLLATVLCFEHVLTAQMLKKGDLSWPEQVSVQEQVFLGWQDQREWLIQELLGRAERQKLGESAAWKALLFMVPGWFVEHKSMIDDPRFFLSARGKTDPAAELEASLRAFLGDWHPPSLPFDENLHPYCRFPARYAWLDEQLGLSELLTQDPHREMFLQRSPAALVECSLQKQFMEYAQYDGLSLVFSNYYLNSPASMFGHTFLRLHRQFGPGRGRKQSHLFDDIVNYAAHVPPNATFGYPIKGTFGLYHGHFTMLPFFQKIQEYTHHESRDLWEYKLNVSSESLVFMTKVLWEHALTFSEYYFFDENCSYALVMLLNAAYPQYKLYETMPLHVIPSDTIRAVVERLDPKAEVTARPSSMSKFVAYREVLDDRQQRVLNQFRVRGAQPKDLLDARHWEQCNQTCRADLLDAALEWIDYLASANPEEHAVLSASTRTSLLLERSRLTTSTEPVDVKVLSSRPDAGHATTQIGLGVEGFVEAEAVGTRQQLAGGGRAKRLFGPELVGRLHWRPALHDLLAPDLGYSPYMSLSFFESQWLVSPAYTSQAGWLAAAGLKLKRLNVVEIQSLAPKQTMIDPMAWQVKLGYEAPLGCGPEVVSDQSVPPSGLEGQLSGVELRSLKGCERFEAKGGVGGNWLLTKDRKSFVFSLVNAQVYRDQRRSLWSAGPSLSAGVLWADKLAGVAQKWLAELELGSLWQQDGAWLDTSSARLRWSWHMQDHSELRAGLAYQYGLWQGEVMWVTYL